MVVGGRVCLGYPQKGEGGQAVQGFGSSFLETNPNGIRKRSGRLKGLNRPSPLKGSQ